MSYTVLARKYRPQRFSDVIGQDHVTRTLKNAIERRRIAHGYIFSGHRGIGKTTVARILAMALNCRSAEHPVAEPCGVCDSCTEIRTGSSVDVIEIDAATNRGIDEIRELRDAARYRPARDRYKVYILDEAHQITDAAFNALLKTLEEPPGHVIFMLATTQPEDIPQTIRSRCQHFSFHAVRFTEILAQLRDIAGQEGIEADDNALAMLAEAGDGSMRDALSILDQAIACCGQRLTAEIVRQLVGSVGSEVLEEVMQAVQRGCSQDVLRLVDRLMTEGHNPTHFARQMVRFVRNATVAKVAGSASPLLQISEDERARVARVAELFSEEDLARFLQILLRTHSELGYKQEQRFHLELGLLKMVHAQRLLPLEQLLSETAPAMSAGSGTGIGSFGRAAQAGSRPEPPLRTPASATRASDSLSQPERASPFQADVARKGKPKPEMKAQTAAAGHSVSAVAGSALAVEEAPEIFASSEIAPAGPEAAPEPSSASLASIEDLRGAVLSALESAGQRMLASMLEAGEWSVAGSEVVVKAALAPSVIEMALSTETKRIAGSALTGVAGRAMKFRVVSGAPAQTNDAPRRSPTPRSSGPGGRSRAAQDPVVRRMQEKFRAEIRTVIDHREKR